jgi:tetratricopeptide (TPR) repeat protein
MRGRTRVGAAAFLACAAAVGCKLEVPDARVPVTASSDEAKRLYRKGQDARDRLDPVQARSYFRRALAEDPEFALAHLGMALTDDTATGRSGSLRIALALSGRVTQGERLLIQAEQARDQGDATALYEYLDDLVDGYPDDAAAQVLLGDFYLERENAVDAVRCYQRAIELAPAIPSAHRGLGRAYAVLGRQAQAEEALLRHAELLPENPLSHELLALSLMKAGRFADSIARFEQALTLDPHRVSAQVGICNDLVFLDRAEEARARLLRLIEAADDDAVRRTARIWLAATHLHEEAHELALDELRAALALAEGAGDTLAASGLVATMGEVLLEAGAVDRAAEHFSRAEAAVAQGRTTEEAKVASRAEGIYHAARVALARNDAAQAARNVTAYRGAIRGHLRPEAKHRFSELEARVALAAGDHRGALERLQRADQGDPRILDLAAQIQRAAGQIGEARKSWTAVATFNEPRFELALVRPRARRHLAEP